MTRITKRNRKNLKGKTKRRNYKIGGTNNNSNSNNSNLEGIPSPPPLIRTHAIRTPRAPTRVNASSQYRNRVQPRRLNFSGSETTRRANGQPETTRRANIRQLSREEIIKKAWRSVSNNNYEFNNSNMDDASRMQVLRLAQEYSNLYSIDRNQAERRYKNDLARARRNITGGKRKNKTKRRKRRG